MCMCIDLSLLCPPTVWWARSSHIRCHNLISGFREPFQHSQLLRPLPAHFYKQTSSLFEDRVPYVRHICPFLNCLMCVGSATVFIAGSCLGTSLLKCLNVVPKLQIFLSMNPVPLGICTILHSMVILLNVYVFLITELIVPVSCESQKEYSKVH